MLFCDHIKTIFSVENYEKEDQKIQITIIVF